MLVLDFESIQPDTQYAFQTHGMNRLCHRRRRRRRRRCVVSSHRPTHTQHATKNHNRTIAYWLTLSIIGIAFAMQQIAVKQHIRLYSHRFKKPQVSLNTQTLARSHGNFW